MSDALYGDIYLCKCTRSPFDILLCAALIYTSIREQQETSLSPSAQKPTTTTSSSRKVEHLPANG